MERPGAYRRVVSETLVPGPIVALRSDHDRALGTFYPAAILDDKVDSAAAAGGRHGRTRELVARNVMGAVGTRGVGAPELDLLEDGPTRLRRQHRRLAGGESGGPADRRTPRHLPR